MPIFPTKLLAGAFVGSTQNGVTSRSASGAQIAVSVSIPSNVFNFFSDLWNNLNQGFVAGQQIDAQSLVHWAQDEQQNGCLQAQADFIYTGINFLPYSVAPNSIGANVNPGQQCTLADFSGDMGNCDFFTSIYTATFGFAPSQANIDHFVKAMDVGSSNGVTMDAHGITYQLVEDISDRTKLCNNYGLTP